MFSSSYKCRYVDVGVGKIDINYQVYTKQVWNYWSM